MLGAVELGFVPNRGRGKHTRAAAPLPPCAKAICGSDYAPRGVTLKWGPASRKYQRCLFFWRWRRDCESKKVAALYDLAYLGGFY